MHPGCAAGDVVSLAMLVLASCTQPPAFAWAAGGQKFRADEWITECDSGPSAGAPDCSITVPFWQTRGEPRGSFASLLCSRRETWGCRPTDSHSSGAPRRQKPADRMQTAALLRVSEHPSTRCLEAAQGWIAYFDRCVYGKGSV